MINQLKSEILEELEKIDNVSLLRIILTFLKSISKEEK